MELEVAALLIQAAPLREAVEVSVLLLKFVQSPLLSDDESAGVESETDCSALLYIQVMPICSPAYSSGLLFEPDRHLRRKV
jgi:hypothetical protein